LLPQFDDPIQILKSGFRKGVQLCAHQSVSLQLDLEKTRAKEKKKRTLPQFGRVKVHEPEYPVGSSDNLLEQPLKVFVRHLEESSQDTRGLCRSLHIAPVIAKDESLDR